MSILLASVLSSISVAAVGSGVSLYATKKWVSGWNERHWTALAHTWSKLFLFSTIIGSAVAFITSYAVESYIIGLLLGVVSYALSFTGVTDYKTKYAPKEVTSFGILAAVIISAIAMLTGTGMLGSISGLEMTSGVQLGLLHSAVWTAFVTLFLVLIVFFKPSGMGLADFKILWLVGFSYVWVIGIVPAMVLFMVAAIAQLVWFSTITAMRKSRDKSLPLIPALSAVYILGGLLYTLV